MEVHEQFDFLALLLVQHITCSRIERSGVALKRSVDTAHFHHALSAIDELEDIKSCASNRKQTDRGEYRETSADVVFDNEGFVTLLGRKGTQGTAFSIRNADDQFFGSRFADLLFELGLEQTECQCRLGCGT